jgi:hypothetical protein
MMKATLAAQIHSRRTLFVAWAVACLFCLVSLEVLHTGAHGILDSGQVQHTCLICQFGQQSTPPQPVVRDVPLPAIVHSSFIFFTNGTDNFACQTSPQPRVPRGPPASFLVCLS